MSDLTIMLRMEESPPLLALLERAAALWAYTCRALAPGRAAA